MTERPDVLLVVVDCLRGDRIHSGAGGARTPNLDRLRESGAAFSNVVSNAGTTVPSFASILTGQPPARHGATMRPEHRLAPDLPLLSERFAAAGWTTYAATTGPLDPRVGLARGWTRYDFRPARETLDSPWAAEILRAIEALPRPWFALVHYWDLHEEITVLPEFDARRFGATSYDRALSGVDQHLGLLLDRLPSGAIVAVMGDHGEDLYRGPFEEIWKRALMECHTPSASDPDRFARARALLAWQRRLANRRVACGGWRTPYSHGFHLYEHLLHVPLLFGGAAGLRLPYVGRDDRLATIEDVGVTLLGLAGAGAAGAEVGGHDLFAPPRRERAQLMYGYDFWFEGGGYLYTGVRTKDGQWIRVRPGPRTGGAPWSEFRPRGSLRAAAPPAGFDPDPHFPDPDEFSGAALSAEETAHQEKLLEELGYID